MCGLWRQLVQRICGVKLMWSSKLDADLGGASCAPTGLGVLNLDAFPGLCCACPGLFSTAPSGSKVIATVDSLRAGSAGEKVTPLPSSSCEDRAKISLSRATKGLAVRKLAVRATGSKSSGSSWGFRGRLRGRAEKARHRRRGRSRWTAWGRRRRSKCGPRARARRQ